MLLHLPYIVGFTLRSRHRESLPSYKASNSPVTLIGTYNSDSGIQYAILFFMLFQIRIIACLFRAGDKMNAGSNPN